MISELAFAAQITLAAPITLPADGWCPPDAISGCDSYPPWGKTHQPPGTCDFNKSCANDLVDVRGAISRTGPSEAPETRIIEQCKPPNGCDIMPYYNPSHSDINPEWTREMVGHEQSDPCDPGWQIILLDHGRTWCVKELRAPRQ